MNMLQSYQQNNDLKQYKLAKKCDLPDNSIIESIIKFNNKIIYVARERDIRRFYQENNQILIQMPMNYDRDITVLVCHVQEEMRSQEYLVVIQKEEKNEIHLDILHIEKEQIYSDTMQFQISSIIVSVFQMNNWLVIIEQNSVIHLQHLENYNILQIDDLKQQNNNLRDAFINPDLSIILFYDQGYKLVEFDQDNKLNDHGYRKIYYQYKQVFNFLGGIILLDIEGGIYIMNYVELTFRKIDYQIVNSILRINNFENNISKFAFFEEKKNQKSNFQQNQTYLRSTNVESNQSGSQLSGQVSVCQIDNGQIKQDFQIQNEQKCDFIYQSDAETYYIGSYNTIYTLEKQNQIIKSSYKKQEDKSEIKTNKRPTQIEKLDKYPEIKFIKDLQVPKNLIEYLNENDQLNLNQNSNYEQSYYGQQRFQGQFQQSFQQIPSKVASQIGSQIQNLIVKNIKLSNDIIYLQYENYIFVCDDTCFIDQTIKIEDMISFIPHIDYLCVASFFNLEDFKMRIYGIEKSDHINIKPSIKYSLKGKPNQEDGILKKSNNIITVATQNGYMTKIENSKLEEQLISQFSIDQVLVFVDKIITLSNSRLIQSYDLKRQPLKKLEIQGIQLIEVYDDKSLIICQREQISSILLLSIDDLKIKKTINLKEEIEKLYCNNKFIYTIANYQLSVFKFDEEKPNNQVYRHQYDIPLQNIHYFSWEDRKLLTSDGADIKIYSIQ